MEELFFYNHQMAINALKWYSTYTQQWEWRMSRSQLSPLAVIAKFCRENLTWYLSSSPNSTSIDCIIKRTSSSCIDYDISFVIFHRNQPSIAKPSDDGDDTEGWIKISTTFYEKILNSQAIQLFIWFNYVKMNDFFNYSIKMKIALYWKYINHLEVPI